MEGSPKFCLNKQDLKKILIGTFIASAGAALTYITSAIAQIDFGQWTPVITAFWAILVNILRRYLSSYEQEVEKPTEVVTPPSDSGQNNNGISSGGC